MKHKNKLILTLAPLLGLTTQLSAQHDFTDAGVGSDWSTAANWTGGVPDDIGSDITTVGLGGNNVAVDITGSVANIWDLRLGDGVGGGASTNGTINHSAGSLTTNNWTIIGVDASGGNTATGTYNLSGTAFYTGNSNVAIGVGGGGTGVGTGIVNVSGSASFIGSNITVGQNDGNTGIFTQTGGTVASNNWITIGEAGGATGSYTISGGTLSAVSDISVGQQDAGTNGTLSVSGTGSVSATTLRIGRNFSGGNDAEGTLNIDGSNASISVANAHFGVEDNGVPLGATQATGNLNVTADAGGVTAIVAGTTTINDGTSIGLTNLTLDLTAIPGLGDGTTPLEIILIDSGSAITGEFANAGEGASISVGGGQTGIISYVGGSGTDLTVTVLVPEPSTALLSLLTVVGLVVRRRR